MTKEEKAILLLAIQKIDFDIVYEGGDIVTVVFYCTKPQQTVVVRKEELNTVYEETNKCTEADVIAFGEYMVSKQREKLIKDPNNKHHVTAADLDQWKAKEREKEEATQKELTKAFKQKSGKEPINGSCFPFPGGWVYEGGQWHDYTKGQININEQNKANECRNI